MALSPKAVLRRCGALALTVAALTLASCGSPSTTPTTTSSEAAGGGTVRVGIIGSSSDSLDVTKATTFLPYGVALNTFDSLAVMSQGQPKLMLAESITPNEDATLWTITIRDGVEFHDGTPLTADDVLSSLKYLTTAPNYGSMFADVDLDNASSDGKLTITLPTTRPRSDLVESVLAQMSMVFPEGTTDFTQPIGSGPFKVESFDPDTGAVLVRNDDYWGGAPELERLEFIPIADATARMSAVTSHQVDYAMGVTPTGIETIAEGSGIAVQDPGDSESNAFMFMLNSNKAPFDDPEVRDAFRIAIDREALVDVVFRGVGTVGNDVAGKGMLDYDDSLPQHERDLDKAKAIFAAKGVTSISVLASEMTPGITDAAKLLAQQLGEAGVEVTVDEVDAAGLWSDLSVIPTHDVFSFFAINRPFVAHATMFNVDGAPGNYMATSDPDFSAAITASQAETDPATRTELLHEAQRIQWDSGSDIVWGYQPVLAAHDEGLQGVEIVLSVPVFHEASYQR